VLRLGPVSLVEGLRRTTVEPRSPLPFILAHPASCLSRPLMPSSKKCALDPSVCVRCSTTLPASLISSSSIWLRVLSSFAAVTAAPALSHDAVIFLHLPLVKAPACPPRNMYSFTEKNATRPHGNPRWHFHEALWTHHALAGATWGCI
jgi:hypothetical protein